MCTLFANSPSSATMLLGVALVFGAGYAVRECVSLYRHWLIGREYRRHQHHVAIVRQQQEGVEL